MQRKTLQAKPRTEEMLVGETLLFRKKDSDCRM